MPTPTPVSDSKSHAQDQIAFVARTIGRSKARRRVFEYVYRGKKKTKTFPEICRALKSNQKTIYNAAKHLAKNHIIHQVRVEGETAYQKDSFLDAHKRTILSLAGSKEKLAKYSTSTNPQGSRTSMVIFKVPRKLIRATLVTIDDVDSFARARGIATPPTVAVDILEDDIKRGVQKVIKEPGTFRHWPGERNDVYTTRVTFRGKRMGAAFAFKGRGTRKKLTPRDMGKTGNQIQRLFTSPAELFFVQYVGQIDESVVEQMHTAAVSKSYSTGKEIYYGIIDGADTMRLITAYPKSFQ